VCFLWTSFSQMHFSQTHFPEYIFPKKISSVCPWLFNRIILPNGNGQFVFLLSKNWRQKITGCQKYIKIIGNIHSKDRLHDALTTFVKNFRNELWRSPREESFSTAPYLQPTSSDSYSYTYLNCHTHSFNFTA